MELDDKQTEVIYRSGARIKVALPFDELYNLWVGEEWEAA